MPHHYLKPVLLFSTLITSTSFAAESLLEPIVVTASRYSESLSATLASTVLITRKDIDNSNAVTLEELLISVPGLDIKPNGSYGKSTSIFMRGAGSSHTVVLIDGAKLYSATGGSTAYQHIPLSQIERIEIVKGSRSGLYGSGAIGGVIHIFTRQGKRQSATSASIESGSNSTSEITTGHSGKTGKLAYSLFLSHLDTQGIDSIEHSTVNDKDGYDNSSVTTNLNYNINSYIDIDFNLLHATGMTQYDNCYNDSFAVSDDCYSDIKQQSVITKLNYKPDANYDVSLQFGQSTDYSNNFWENTPNNTFETIHSSLTIQSNIQLSENHLLIAGIDNTEDDVAATPYNSFDNTRDNNALFLSWKGTFNETTINSSLRNDDNEQFGSHVTGSLSAGYDITETMNTFISYGTGFNAPTFNDLYFPFYGNEDLIQEESRTFEIGIRESKRPLMWEVNLYKTNIDNLIAYDSSIFIANNISKAEIDGIEATLHTKFSNWDVKFTTSYLEPINKDSANYGNILPGRLQQSTSIDLSREFGKTYFSLKLLNQGKRFVNVINDQTVDEYTKVDVKARHKLYQTLILSAEINNLLDEEYAANGDGFSTYPAPRRTIFIGLEYRM